MNLLVIRIVAFYSQERLLEKLREEEAASQAVFLKGDVICLNKPRTVTAPEQAINQQQWMHSSQASICSCTCLETFSDWRQTRKQRTEWKKEQKERASRAAKSPDSVSSMKFIFALRRSSV